MTRFIVTAFFVFNFILSSASLATKMPAQVCVENTIHKMQFCKQMASGAHHLSCRDNVKQEHDRCIKG